MDDVTRRTVLGGRVAGMLFGSTAVRPATATSAWPTYQGDAGRTGYIAAIPTTASVEWELDLESPTGASPVVADDHVYLGADGVYAIDRSGSSVTWHTTAIESVNAAVCATADLVVGLTLDWEAFALDRESGDLRWSIPTDGRSHAGPLVRGETAYLRDDRSIRAISVADGDERWVRDLADGERPPAFGDGKVYVGDHGGNLYAIDESGELAWHREFPAPVRCAPTYDDGIVYVGSGSSSGRIHALDADDGSERWHVPTPAGRPYAPPEDVFVAALQQPHDAANYEITYSYQDAADVDASSQRLGVLKVDNAAGRFYLEGYGVEPPRQLYGTPVTRWGSTADSEEWSMRTTADRSINHFTDLPTLDAGSISVYRENETEVVLELEDDELIHGVIVDSYLRGSAYTDESWLRVHVDKDKGQLDRVEYFTREGDETGEYQVQDYDGYGETDVNRPDDIPFSLREKIRLFLSWIGLL